MQGKKEGQGLTGEAGVEEDVKTAGLPAGRRRWGWVIQCYSAFQSTTHATPLRAGRVTERETSLRPEKQHCAVEVDCRSIDRSLFRNSGEKLDFMEKQCPLKARYLFDMKLGRV